MAKLPIPTEISVHVGYAAGERDGLALALLRVGSRERLVRVVFPLPEPGERLIGYAALGAVADAVLARGIRAARFYIGDDDLVRDLAERRPLAAYLVLPYVALGCRLNRFHSASVVAGEAECRDLTARARADNALRVAA